jgi:uncharacterized protein (DUF934 family)
MSDTQKKLWRGGRFVMDEWHRVEALEAIEDGDVIVPLSLLQEAGAKLLSRNSGRTGVLLEAGEDIGAIEPFLDRLSLIALAFPAFTDGRAYSKAVRLRQQHGFDGEIRAVGDVLIDQVAFMQRCGFDALEVSNDFTAGRLVEDRGPKVGRYYQPAVDEAAKTPTYSWRRSAAPAR